MTRPVVMSKSSWTVLLFLTWLFVLLSFGGVLFVLIKRVYGANTKRYQNTLKVRINHPLDVSPGVGRTPGVPEESRSTQAHYTCRPYMCTQYICLYICWAAGFEDLG